MRVIGWSVTPVLIGLAATAYAQHHPSHPATPAKEPSKSIRTTMEALHRAGGVPPGWKFTLPAGNPVAGRKVFVELGCHSCHEVKGEQFPTQPGEKRDAGPELTGMGAAHPTEFLAEAILNPNAVIIDEPGFTGPDGRSKMPTFNDDMTVTQFIDLAAYLKSLTGGGHGTPEKPASAPSHQRH